MASCIKRVVKHVIGESKGCGQLTQETWWCKKEVQAVFRLKRELYRSLPICRDNAAYENYKVAKREEKKVVQEAKCNTYDELYSELGAKDGENNIYKLVKTREMKTK